MPPIANEAMSNWPRLRADIKIMDPISIELPAVVWWSFFVSYFNNEWSDAYANIICDHIQHTMLDPVFIREQLAEMQKQHDEAQKQAEAQKAWMQKAGMLPPDPPEDSLFQ